METGRNGNADGVFVPAAPELLLPIPEIVLLQVFAYYMAVRKGECNGDVTPTDAQSGCRQRS
jgi:glucosamine 6-phosphate synthetase-like amidotransferase/phosphosugar isomerase protein